MFLLFQSVAQQLTPINVTVQSPAGMPEWAKILISAGTGAVLGILSNIAMEYVKPLIGKRVLIKSVAQQLAQELMENLAQIESVIRLLETIDLDTPRARDSALDIADIILKNINRDRYEFYFATQKALVYEVDSTKELSGFYVAIKELGLRMPQRRAHAFVRAATLAAALGTKYIERHGLDYKPKPSTLEELYKSIIADRDADEGLRSPTIR